MTGNVQFQPDSLGQCCKHLEESIGPSSDWQQLAQENGCLRVIVAELLMKNQNLRWALQKQGSV